MSIATLCLYGATILFAVIFAFRSYRIEPSQCSGETGIHTQARIDFRGMIITFLILWQLPALSACGADYKTYNYLFLHAKDLEFILIEHQLEVGYAALNYVIRIFTDNVHIYNGIFSFLFLGVTFYALYRLRDRVHFGWAILVFTCIFYLQFLNLKRIYMAAAICLLAVSFLCEKSYKKYVLFVILAASFHTSALLALAPLAVYFFITKGLKWWHIFGLAVLMIGGCYFFGKPILSLLFEGRYAKYGFMEADWGYTQLLFHLPFIWFLGMKMDRREEDVIRFGFSFAICSFILSSFGYFIIMIGRSFVYFMFPFALAPSLVNLDHNGDEEIYIFGLSSKKVFNIIMVLYCLGRLFIYCWTFFEGDGIMPYKNIFGQVF